MWNNDLEGNYWSDYVGLDMDNDGIGDSARAFDAGNIDTRPLMGMFSSFGVSADLVLNVISNSQIDSCQYVSSDGIIRMYVSEVVGETGFCRICIPLSLMNVTVVEVSLGNETVLASLLNPNVFDNSTHRWIYFSYDKSTREIVIVPEYSLPIALFLFVAATFSCSLIALRKHCYSVSKRAFRLTNEGRLRS
ncbi:hypothetical protein A3K79_05815 [Candidatus Bathyarchaeota archaeon RBG_13_46_16b]|nr:MAG: hypothetical protein A3K79_05815 [Candidatus Bathyarchaeota archaeon RBG_13_46_16b]